MNALLVRVEALLQGEPARAIGYGAAVVVYVVALATGKAVTFDQAVGLAVAAIALIVPVVEFVRHYVFSPATVAAMAAAPPKAA